MCVLISSLEGIIVVKIKHSAFAIYECIVGYVRLLNFIIVIGSFIKLKKKYYLPVVKGQRR